MQSPDTCCTLVPYFKVNDGQLGAFKALCERFEARTRSEPGCAHYAFSFDGDAAGQRAAGRATAGTSRTGPYQAWARERVLSVSVMMAMPTSAPGSSPKARR